MVVSGPCKLCKEEVFFGLITDLFRVNKKFPKCVRDASNRSDVSVVWALKYESQPVCLFVCLSVCLSVGRSVGLSVCRSVCHS